jgi:hypothetical protein
MVTFVNVCKLFFEQKNESFKLAIKQKLESIKCL